MEQTEGEILMNIDRAKGVTNGFMSDAELEWLASHAEGRQMIAEIGSWTGRSTLALACNTTGKVFAVDTWNGSDNGDLKDVIANHYPGWVFDQFRQNTEDCTNIYVKRLPSLVAARLFEPQTFDLVFIDAAHDYVSVLNDIRTWLPLLKRGGILCGHDYCDERWPGVTKAVDELFPHRLLMTPNNGERSIWWTLA